LLREHGMRVNEVADKLGFSSPCYFSKVFKERTGQAPSSYRRGSEKQN
ncbi:MAG: AraC family transcriptional regulator, partial [Candidatus Pacebacteria bacterium]|nr:AraC family transcriptional regulator [Candidatus Paceibacterota bacterium]